MGAGASSQKQRDAPVEDEASAEDVLDPNARLVRLSQCDAAQVLHWLPPNSGAGC